MSQDYDSYYGGGDEAEILRDESGQRRNYTKRINERDSINGTEDLQSKVGDLESKNNALEWKIKALGVSGMILLICSLGLLVFTVIQQLNIGQLSDTEAQVGEVPVYTIIYNT